MNSVFSKAITVFCIPLAFSPHTHGLSLEASAAIKANYSHNDNIRLVNENKTAVNEVDLTPNFDLDLRTENTKVHFGSLLTARRFDKSEFDSNDQNINLSISRVFERASAGVEARYIHDSTLTSELLSSGRIGTQAERAEQYVLLPNFSYSLNEKNLASFNGQYVSQNYGSDDYIGYSNSRAELAWIHITNEKLKWILSSSYSDYQSDDREFSVPAGTIFGVSATNGLIYFIRPNAFGEQTYTTRMQDTALSIGADYIFSEQSVIQLRLGWAEDKLTYPIDDVDNVCENTFYLNLPADIKAQTGALCATIPAQKTTITTAEIDWTWQGENQKFSLDLSKATQPTSNGYAVDATRLQSSWSYQFSELDRFLVDFSISRNRGISEENSLQNTSIADRDFGSVKLTYEKQIDEHWFIDASYRYTIQKYTTIDYDAISRIAGVGVSYRPTRWFW